MKHGGNTVPQLRDQRLEARLHRYLPEAAAIASGGCEALRAGQRIPASIGALCA
jgi:hypothetical protein